MKISKKKNENFPKKDNFQKKWKFSKKIFSLPNDVNFSVYLTILNLSEGDYQYRYIVDGVERFNPREKSVTDEKGRTNNVIR